MEVVLEHLTDVAGRVHVENVNIRIHIHPTSTFVRFSVPFDVHTVFVSLRVPRMQPVACLRQKMLDKAGREDKADVTESFWVQEQSESDEE